MVYLRGHFEVNGILSVYLTPGITFSSAPRVCLTCLECPPPWTIKQRWEVSSLLIEWILLLVHKSKVTADFGASRLWFPKRWVSWPQIKLLTVTVEPKISRLYKKWFLNCCYVRIGSHFTILLPSLSFGPESLEDTLPLVPKSHLWKKLIVLQLTYTIMYSTSNFKRTL